MQEIDVLDYSEQILKALPKGVFLNTKAGDKKNSMTIGWGALGRQWNKTCFTIMVRLSRYTKGLIDENPVFTLSVPLKGDFKEAVAICGTKSGRDMDKLAACKFDIAEAETVDGFIIKGCGLHIECEIADVRVMDATTRSQEVKDAWYKDEDWHVYYTALVKKAYIE